MGLTYLSGFVETVATFLKKTTSLVQNAAEEVADFGKCVIIVSSAFQVCVLCAKLADMGMEMKRRVDAWSRIQTQVEKLRRAIVESMELVLHPDRKVNDRLVENVLRSSKT